jgi:hypothetical protein
MDEALMSMRRIFTGWLLLFCFAAAAACVDPTLPRIPPPGDEEEDDDDDTIGLDLRTPPPPFYLV